VRLARVAVLLVAIGVPVDAAEPLDPVLYSEIQRLAAMLTDGFATLDQADAYRFGPKAALSDHVVVMLAMTSWGGGNGSRQFMAVFRHNESSDPFPGGRQARPYQFVGLVQVGSGFDRWFEKVELRQNLVVLTGRRWARSDAHCCPSLPARAVYRVSEHGLNQDTP